MFISQLDGEHLKGYVCLLKSSQSETLFQCEVLLAHNLGQYVQFVVVK